MGSHTFAPSIGKRKKERVGEEEKKKRNSVKLKSWSETLLLNELTKLLPRVVK